MLQLVDGRDPEDSAVFGIAANRMTRDSGNYFKITGRAGRKRRGETSSVMTAHTTSSRSAAIDLYRARLRIAIDLQTAQFAESWDHPATTWID